jgi:hypothetical protein
MLDYQEPEEHYLCECCFRLVHEDKWSFSQRCCLECRDGYDEAYLDKGDDDARRTSNEDKRNV